MTSPPVSKSNFTSINYSSHLPLITLAAESMAAIKLRDRKYSQFLAFRARFSNPSASSASADDASVRQIRSTSQERGFSSLFPVSIEHPPEPILVDSLQRHSQRSGKIVAEANETQRSAWRENARRNKNSRVSRDGESASGTTRIQSARANGTWRGDFRQIFETPPRSRGIKLRLYSRCLQFYRDKVARATSKLKSFENEWIMLGVSMTRARNSRGTRPGELTIGPA